ncbi:MAG: phosphate propanoyltransferase [Lysinibacillus sp.]
MAKKTQVPIGVSARHVHLTNAHIEQLFGAGAVLTFDFPLSQLGQFAAIERVKLETVKGVIDGVRVLGPARSASQVEISKTDSLQLGLQPPIRLSGDIAGSESITLVGPNGKVLLNEGVIIAKAHIHMHPDDAQQFEVEDGEEVDVVVNSERPITFRDVVVRVHPQFKLDMHIDTDEGNAANISQGVFGTVVKKGAMLDG